MSQLQVTVMFSGFYLLIGLAIVFVAMEYNQGAKKVFSQLIEMHWIVWLSGAMFAAVIWPLILFEEIRRAIRRWRHPALKWTSGTPEFDEAVGRAVRKSLSSNKYLKEKIDKFIEKNPKCLRCGVEGKLRQYDLSLWVICDACNGRIFTLDPSTPESVDQVPTFAGLPPCGSCGAPVLDWEEQKVKWKSRPLGHDLVLASMDPNSIRCQGCRKDTI